jgi:hypothetical protein
MRKDKKMALGLRKQGKSYNEIRDRLNIPKSTLSDWLTKLDWSETIKHKLVEKSAALGRVHLEKLDRTRGIALEKIYEEAQLEAIREFENLKWYPLFTAGIALYWGEGDKATNGVVRLANVDPDIIRTFILFLREVCGVPEKNIRVHLLLYPDLNPRTCLQFWSEQIDITRQNFTKCVTIQGRHKTKRLPYGVCYVTVSSTYLKKKIFVWLALLSKELAKQKVAGIV